MSFNDPIAECLTTIRNGLSARHKYVDIIMSKEKKAIVKILHEEGFILNYLVDDSKKRMRIFLKYKNRSPIIQGIKRVSNPGLRKYLGWRDLPSVFNGFGIAIISTSQGIMTDHEAREKKVGGEFLCKVW